MVHDTETLRVQRGPTYAAPVTFDELPTSSTDRRVRTRLTGPVVIAAAAGTRWPRPGAEAASGVFFEAS